MVKYNVRELVSFLIKIELEEFVELGYPKTIADFDFDSDEIQMCLNSAVFDIDNGLVIKMAEGQEVTQAIKGSRKLS